ncbi:MAG: peptidoglycan editing factor PgeF [Proteobacteria bacterium]|nr:peptidoglycan editing factor PgeF [Pseudomonadota bacterium]
MQTIKANTPLPHADHAFGTRMGAFGSIEENIRQLTERLGPIAHMRQVHGDKISYASGPGVYEETDAIFTDRPELWLGVTTADCVPILISSPEAVAAVHAGWRGLQKELIRKTIQTLTDEFELEPAQIFMHIGPCIRQMNYEVEATFTEYFDGRFFIPSKRPGHLMLDLAAVAREQARDEGIPTDNIHDTGLNTYAEHTRFFSYRASKEFGDPHNVQLNLVCRKRR